VLFFEKEHLALFVGTPKIIVRTLTVLTLDSLSEIGLVQQYSLLGILAICTHLETPELISTLLMISIGYESFTNVLFRFGISIAFRTVNLGLVH